MNALTRIGALVVLAGANVAFSQAQPEGADKRALKPQEAPAGRQREPISPEQMKAGLLRWLEENNRAQERIRAAIQKLEEIKKLSVS